MEINLLIIEKLNKEFYEKIKKLENDFITKKMELIEKHESKIKKLKIKLKIKQINYL